MAGRIFVRQHHRHAFLKYKNLKTLHLFIPLRQRYIVKMMRNTEGKVLRELRSTHTLGELNPEQRKNLHQFCKTWVDIFIDLDMLKEKSFEQFINESLKGKSDKEIKDWYFNRIVDCELKLSKERDAENIERFKGELRILSLRAFGFCGMHLHTVKVI